MKNILKKIFTPLLLAFLTISSLWIVNANVTYFDWAEVEIPYGWDWLWLKEWVEAAKQSVRDINTTGTFSETVQEVVIYLLWFVTLIAVIYIIYAGFRILTSSWDEETIKKSKNTIIYVIIGIVVIWFAWTIANFAINIWSGGWWTSSSWNSWWQTCEQIYNENQCENTLLCSWDNWWCENKL